MRFTEEELTVIDNLTNSKDGKVLAGIFARYAAEVKDPSQYESLTGEQYEMEMKSSSKAAGKIEDFVKNMIVVKKSKGQIKVSY